MPAFASISTLIRYLLITVENRPIQLREIYARPECPLHLDIGCARGRFILRMAEAEPEWNFLGVEIREPLVIEANGIAAEAGLDNLHYEFCNAMLWLDRLIAEIPAGLLQRVSIQFPDPWFKKRHSKRRMVNGAMLDAIAGRLAIGGRVFVQTDIEPLSAEMFTLFREHFAFEPTDTTENAFPIKTERENAVEAKGLPVYRAGFLRRE